MPLPLQLERTRLRPPTRSLAGSGFYARRAEGRGVFITRDQWEGNPAAKLTSVFRRVAGVQVARFYTGNRDVYRLKSRRYTANIRDGFNACWMMYIDGMLVADSNELPFELDSHKLEDFEAMDVYRGPAETPAQYNATGSSCGVVLMWTKAALSGR